MYELTKTDKFRNYERIDNRTLPPLPAKYVVDFIVWHWQNGKRIRRTEIRGVGTTKNAAKERPHKVLQRAQQHADQAYRRHWKIGSGETLIFKVVRTEIVTLKPKDVYIKRYNRKGKYRNEVRRLDSSNQLVRSSAWTNKRTELIYDEALGERVDISMEIDSVEMYMDDDFSA